MNFGKHLVLAAAVLTFAASSAAAVSDSVSLTLVEDFDKYESGQSANFYTTSGAAVAKDGANGYMGFVSSEAKPETAAKTVRPVSDTAVLEFKVKDLTPEANFSVYLRDESYAREQVFFLRENAVNSADKSVAFGNGEDWTRLVFVFDLKNGECSLSVDEGEAVKIPMTFGGKKICGVEFVLVGTDNATAKLDDVRFYPGSEMRDEYDLLSMDGKKQYIMKNNVALFLDYSTAVCNNEPVAIDKDDEEIKPVISDGYTLVPLRFVSEGLGADVLWDGDEQIITVSLGEISAKMQIGKKEITVNGETRDADIAPVLIGGRTMVPLRLVAETLEKKVTWDDRGLIVVSADDMINTVAESDTIKDKLIYEMTGSAFLFVDGEKVQTTDSLKNIHMKKIDAVSVVADYEPQEENSAANSIDGDLGTRWSSDLTGTNITIDLGEEKNIGGYAVAWSNGSLRVNYYRIEYSADGVSWTGTVDKISSGTSEGYEFYRTEPIKARYVRYSGFGTLTHEGIAGSWNSVSEFVVFEEGE